MLPPQSQQDAVSESLPEYKIKLKRRRLAGRKKLCPKCLSQLKLASSLSGWLVPDYYYCPNCGYSGYVALEEMPKDMEKAN